MIKKLTKIGRGRGIVLDKALLDRLEIGDEDSIELVPSADGVLLRKAAVGAPRKSEPDVKSRAAGERLPFEGRIDTMRAWVDGGSRGNPGPAGYGAYILDGNGHLLAEKSGYLGVATNNVAEYQGLLAALRAAHELGARDVTVFADSELMVRQMTGRYQVKNETLRKLFAQAKSLADRIPRFTIKHVPREQNRDADRLANEAMDRGE